MPHVWLERGISIHDRIGDGYTLLQVGGSGADVAGLSRAMAEHGAPFTTLSVESDAARQIYGHALIVVRPDLHVVWRGNRPPDNPAALAALITGHTVPS